MLPNKRNNGESNYKRNYETNKYDTNDGSDNDSEYNSNRRKSTYISNYNTDANNVNLSEPEQ